MSARGLKYWQLIKGGDNDGQNKRVLILVSMIGR